MACTSRKDRAGGETGCTSPTSWPAPSTVWASIGDLETIAAVDELPSGLGWLPDGTLQAASLQNGRLLACRDGRTAAVAEMRSVTGFPCNDMVIDRCGRAYVGSDDTDFGVVTP